MNIFEALRQDHDQQRRLIDQLTDTHGDSQARRDLLAQTKTALQAHAAAEERCFYIPLMESDQTQEKARHSVAEHHELDELIETLEATDPASPGWLAHARNLQHTLVHHLDEEEQEVFQMAGKVLSEQRKQTLATQYRNEMQAQAQ